MQITALSRTLPICRRLSPAAICGSIRFRPARLASLVASREYRDWHLYAEKDKQSSPQGVTAVNHPLSVQNLRQLAPDVPHTFFSRSRSPYFNLAVEHHLLTYSPPSSRILFTYTNTPCVVIGRNQNPWTECNLRTIAGGTSDGRPVEFIRRRSGGGTVFHDEGNLNYTVIVPAEGFERRTHVQMVVDALQSIQGNDYVSRRWAEVKVTDRNDIVARLDPKCTQEGVEKEEWFKVSGTAFKLTRGRALHHGTLLHSSPYIDAIGGFLQSPGKDYIAAKGVESVRSPVINLWNATSASQRRFLAYSIRKTIERVWAEKYAVESSDPLESIQIADGRPEETIPELIAGIEELKTQAWRWDQTPGFSFDSKDIVILGQSLRLAFEVKNGLVQSVKASEEVRAMYEQRLVGKSIRELSAKGNWRRILMRGNARNLPEKAMLQLLGMCFPMLENEAGGQGMSEKPESGRVETGSTAETGTAETAITDAGIAETRPQNSRPLPSHEWHMQDNIRLQRDEARLLEILINAIDRHDKIFTTWSTIHQRLHTTDEKPSRAGNMIRKMGGKWLHLVVNDLAFATQRVTVSIRQMQRPIERLLRPARNRKRRKVMIKVTPLYQRVEEIEKQIRWSGMRLARVLTRVLVEERRRKRSRGGRVGLYDDDDYGVGGVVVERERGRGRERNSEEEGMSNAQGILEATLRMIEMEDRERER